MKPLNFCLDYLLEHLYKNRFRPEGQRVPFDIDHVVLPSLRLTNHHEFVGLIDILIDDGCAIKLAEPNMEWLDYYKNRILITPKGINLLGGGGYTWKKRWDIVKNIANAANVLILCFVAVAGIWITTRENKKENESDLNQRNLCPIDSVHHNCTGEDSTKIHSRITR